MTEPTTTKTTGNKCLCGCGTPCGKTFAPGHDARMVSKLFADLRAINLPGRGDTAQRKVDAIFAKLPTDALRAKLGRMVDNDKDGLYNSLGDNGVYVPFSANPSLGAHPRTTK